MADGLSSSTDTFSATINDQAVKACSAVGINLLGSERVKLSKMGDSIREALGFMREATDWYEFRSNALLALSLTKATCDAFIAMAGSMGEALGLKGTGKVAEIYDIAGTAVDPKANAMDVATKVARASTENLGVKYVTLSTDIINQGLKQEQDLDGLKNRSLAFVYETHKDAGAYAMEAAVKEKYLSEKGGKVLGGFGKALDAMKTVAEARNKYAEDLKAAFDEKLSDEDFMREKKEQMAKLETQLSTIIAQVAQIDGALTSCANQMAALPKLALR